MTEILATVTAPLSLSLVVPGGPSLPVGAIATYRADDPWAVHVAFQTGERTIAWLFARQLLTDGLQTSAGEGDVQVWPAEALVMVAMDSPSGSAVFELGRAELADFLQATYAVVPVGAEALHIDLDAELSSLVATD